MGGVLCSTIVSERLKLRKSLEIHYWQDIIFGVEVNNNVININKVEVSQNLGCPEFKYQRSH